MLNKIYFELICLSITQNSMQIVSKSKKGIESPITPLTNIDKINIKEILDLLIWNTLQVSPDWLKPKLVHVDIIGDTEYLSYLVKIPSSLALPKTSYLVDLAKEQTFLTTGLETRIRTIIREQTTGE